MKIDGYSTVCQILEMPIGAAFTHASKRIGKRMVKDPLALSIAATPIPGSLAVAPVAHFARNKRSRDMGRVVVRKLMHPMTRWSH